MTDGEKARLYNEFAFLAQLEVDNQELFRDTDRRLEILKSEREAITKKAHEINEVRKKLLKMHERDDEPNGGLLKSEACMFDDFFECKVEGGKDE